MKIFGRYRKFSVIALVILIGILSLAASVALGSSGESKSSGGVTVMPDWTVGIQIINFLVILWQQICVHHAGIVCEYTHTAVFVFLG